MAAHSYCSVQIEEAKMEDDNWADITREEVKALFWFIVIGINAGLLWKLLAC
jgi:hypothetical protein